MNWLDRTIGYVSPAWGAQRMRARDLMTVRKFDGASTANRTSHWLTQNSAARVDTELNVAALRSRSHDLLRNNPYAVKGIGVIVNHIVGRGIRAQFRSRATATPSGTSATATDAGISQVELSWRGWAETNACDADGINNLYGLQRLIARTVAESGSCLIRNIRSPRRKNTGADLPPIAIQVLEPDFLDRQKDGAAAGGAFISHGKEYDARGALTGYWIYDYHPGDPRGTPSSKRVAATEIAHVFRIERAGQTDGVPWLSPVMIRLKDFDEFEDAFLFRQKIANCHAAFIYDSNPDAVYSSSLVETLEPGAVEVLPPGKDIKFNNPPNADGSEGFRRFQMMTIAAGLQITYESMSNDLGNVNFSSGRMGRLEMSLTVSGWQYHMLIPMGLDRISTWFLEAQGVSGADTGDIYAQWTPPKPEMVDPSKEIPPIREAVRAGLISPQEAIRKMGYDPDEILDDWQVFAAELDSRGLVLDIDPRHSTLGGKAIEDGGEDATVEEAKT